LNREKELYQARKTGLTIVTSDAKRKCRFEGSSLAGGLNLTQASTSGSPGEAKFEGNTKKIRDLRGFSKNKYQANGSQRRNQLKNRSVLSHQLKERKEGG